LIIFLAYNKFGKNILQVDLINFQKMVKTALDINYQVEKSSGHGVKKLNDTNGCVVKI